MREQLAAEIDGDQLQVSGACNQGPPNQPCTGAQIQPASAAVRIHPWAQYSRDAEWRLVAAVRQQVMLVLRAPALIGG